MRNRGESIEMRNAEETRPRLGCHCERTLRHLHISRTLWISHISNDEAVTDLRNPSWWWGNWQCESNDLSKLGSGLTRRHSTLFQSALSLMLSIRGELNPFCSINT